MSKKIGGKTQEEIDAFVKEHGKGNVTLVTLKETGQHFWFKKPDMNTMKASAKIGQDNPIEGAIVYFTNCLIDGDKKACEDPGIFASLAEELNNLLHIQETEVKNF